MLSSAKIKWKGFPLSRVLFPSWFKILEANPADAKLTTKRSTKSLWKWLRSFVDRQMITVMKISSFRKYFLKKLSTIFSRLTYLSIVDWFRLKSIREHNTNPMAMAEITNRLFKFIFEWGVFFNNYSGTASKLPLGLNLFRFWFFAYPINYH